MIPRNLPRLAHNAIEKGWEMGVEHDHYYRGIKAILAYFLRGEDEVTFVWDVDDGDLVTSDVNGTPTPYTQCTRLIREEPQ